MTDTLPAGLTATNFTGTGWTCNLATLTATRNDVLASGASYPDLVLTVNVATNAPLSVVNTATVSGGDINPDNNTATDNTTILYVDSTSPVITIIKPTNGASVNISTGSLIIVKFTDSGSGIDPASVEVEMVTGEWTTATLTGDTLYYMLKQPLADGEHTVTFKVKDNAGNVTEQSVTFTWENYRRGFGFGRMSF